MERGFKYRIYPNESQRDQIARTLGSCRFVYNRALDVKKSAYAKTGKTVSWAELSRMLPAWKRDPETSWLAQVDSMALQQSIRDLDRAYKNFFRRVREGGKPGFPKFKSRRHARQSYRTNGGKVLDRNHIALPKLGTVRAKVSRPLQGRFMSVTVSLDAAGRYFATFLCTDVPAKDTTATDRESRNRSRRRDACDSLGRHENRESASSQEIRAQARAGAAQAFPQEGRTQGREAERQVHEAAEEGLQDPRQYRRCQNRCPSQGHDHARGREPSPVHGGPECQGHDEEPSSGESRDGRLVRRVRTAA